MPPPLPINPSGRQVRGTKTPGRIYILFAVRGFAPRSVLQGLQGAKLGSRACVTPVLFGIGKGAFRALGAPNLADLRGL